MTITEQQASPFWLTAPCPTWCAYPETHVDGDHPEDRTHFSEDIEVALTTAEPIASGEPGRRWTYQRITGQLQQDYREAEPLLALAVNGEDEFKLSLTEAAQLAEGIQHLLTLAQR